MIGLKNSRHSPNQSDAKLESIKTWSPTFSRAVGSFVVLLEFSLALTSFFSFLPLDVVVTFVLCFTTLNRKAL